MPRISVDESGRRCQHDVLGGRAQVLQYDHRPGIWFYRQYLPAQRKYLTRSLEEQDLQKALRGAEDLYLALSKELDPEGTPLLTSASIEDLLKQWVRINEDRQSSGQITEATVRGKTTALLGAVSLYLLKHLGLRTVGQIKQDTFLGYRTWRLTEGWKHIDSTWGRKPPKDSSVKRELVHIKDWFKNFLIPRGYTQVVPSFERIVIRKDQLDANPPIPLEPDWQVITRHLRKWAEEGKEHRNPRVAYWRQLFRHFVLISYNAGTRPKELLGTVERQRAVERDGSIAIKEVIRGGLRWEDVEVDMAVHTHDQSGKTFEVPEAVLFIRESKTGVPREVPCNAGRYFIRWRQFTNEYRAAHGLPALTKKDFVFFNPYTGRPYPYSQVSRTWEELRNALEDDLSPIRTDQQYTLYSLRSSYITNQIEEGKDIYLIKRITGHSLEILTRHYDRSDVKKRRAEATARTYGKKEKRPKAVDLETL